MAVTVTLIGKNKLSGPFGKGARSIGRMGKAIGGLGLKFAKFGAIAGVAIAGIGIKLAADLEEGLREVGTLMGGLTDNQMKNMTKELESLAASSGKAIDTLVKAKYDIVSAGFSSAADSANLLTQATQLSIAGVADVAAAGDLLTTVMNSYNLAAEDAALISDRLFKTVEVGKTTIDRMAGSLGRVTGIAGTLGIDMNELLAAFATLTTSMGSSERATTALSGTINAMLTPTAELEKIVEDLGFASSFALIQAEGFAESLRLVKQQADESGTPLTDVFSNLEALQGILPLTGVSAEKFAENIEKIGDSAGSTARAVEEMEKSFSQDMRKLRQNVNNILRAIGRGLITIIQPGVKEANELLSSLGDIGWDAIALSMSENWGQIAESLIEILSKALEILSVKLKVWGIVARATLKAALDPTISKEAGQEFSAAWKKWGTDEINKLFEEMKEIGVSSFKLIVVEAERTALDTAAALKAIEDAARDMGGVFEITREQWEKLVEGMLTSSGTVDDALEGTINVANLLGQVLGDVFDPNTSGGNAFKKFVVGIISAIEGVIVAAAAMNQALTFAWIPIIGAAGVVAALVALEAAKAGVRAIKFQQGGVVPLQFGTISSGTDTIPALLSPGEIVSTQQASNLFGPQITRMNQIAEGLGGAQGGGGDTFIINAVDAQSFENMLKRNGLALGRGIRQATRDRNLTMTDLPSG